MCSRRPHYVFLELEGACFHEVLGWLRSNVRGDWRGYRANRSPRRVYIEGLDYDANDRDEVRGEAGLYFRFDREFDAAAFVLRFG